MTVDSAELRRLVAAGTENGRWRWKQRRGMVLSANGAIAGTYGARDQREAKAALIVAAVNALPVLLDQLETYRDALTDILDVGRTATGYDELEACISLARAALDTKQP